MKIEEKLEELGLELRAAMAAPSGARLPFAPVRLAGDRAYVSGHLPLNPDGSLYELRGQLGVEVNVEQGYEAAGRVALAVLGDLKRELGDLDRVSKWLRVFGMVNTAPGFDQQPAVVNGFSDLIIEVYGQEAGVHARSAIGVAGLPFNVPVEIEAEVFLS